MADAPAFKEWILEAIDQLRKRKARPDLDRICHMLERRHGAGFAQVQKHLDTLVQAGVVVKVDYKGSTSFRNAAKWIKTVGRNATSQVLDSSDVSAAVGQALRKQKNAGNGVTLRDIEKQLAESSLISRLIRPDALAVALDKAVTCGRIRKTPSGLYTLPEEAPTQRHQPQSTQQQQQPPVRAEAEQLKTTEPSASGVRRGDGEAGFATGGPTNASAGDGSPAKPKEKEGHKKTKDVDGSANKTKEGEEKIVEQTITRSAKRPASPPPVGRPGSRRKRVKKFHGPDFIDSSSLPSPEGLDAEDPRCDYCFLMSSANPKGQPEDLLRCTDCNAKAHPSCMEYSPELAKKSRLGPWQCMDCKACFICQGSVNGDCMLFCDQCDKGYHMKCHQPKVTEKPTGKWLCSKCSPEPKPATVPKTETTLVTPTRGRPRRGAKPSSIPVEINSATAGLPTPCDSPVSDCDSSPECDEKSSAVKSAFSEMEIDKYPDNIPDAKDWTIHDVAKFFTLIGFPEQAPAFKDQEIDGKSLLLMKRSDVLTGLSIRLGPALKIYNHIKRLQTGLPDGHLAVH